MKNIILMVIFFLALIYESKAKVSCIKSIGIGEAIIKDNYQSAEEEALLKAKWNAIEKAFGTQIQVKEVLENFKLLDEVILKDVKGFVKDLQIIKEEKKGNLVRIYIKTCVYPKEAEKALALLTKQTKIGVIFLMEDKNNIYLDKAGLLSAKLTKELIEQGLQIYSFSNEDTLLTFKLENFLKEKKVSYLEDILKLNLLKGLIVGKISFTTLAKKGQDIGYGIKSSFIVVKAYAKYFFLLNEKGKIKILFSGLAKAKGFGTSEEEAKQKALENISQDLVDDIVYNINKYTLFKRNVVTIVVDNVISLDENFELKKELQKLPWVKSVKDIGIGKFKVEYLENPIYLANSLEKILHYQVKEFTPTKIIIEIN